MVEEDDAILVEEAWRFSLADYAYTLSKGLWIPYPHLEYTARRIQDAILKGAARIVVSQPPRHGKSELISHWLPTWYLDWFPQNRVILGSYGDSLAADLSRKVRDNFLFNDQTWTRLDRKQLRTNDWRTTKEGGMRSASVGGPVTGHGGQLLLVDDPHKSWEEIMSRVIRNKVIDWFNATFYTRAEPGASIIVVQTRWHERDLAGYLLAEHGDDWEEIRLPGLAEENDILGREVGEALCVDRYTAKDLTGIKTAIGSQKFAGLYQQRPSIAEGNIIQRDWIKYYGGPTGIELPAVDPATLMQSWDMSFKNIVGGSYVVGQVWGSRGADHYLLDQIRGRWDFTETQHKVQLLTERWPSVSAKLIEEAANGPAIMSSLRDTISGMIPIRARDSKSGRLSSIAPLFESGNVWLPHPTTAPWVSDLVEELVSFPNAENDDQVDALSQALNRYRIRPVRSISVPAGNERINPWVV